MGLRLKFNLVLLVSFALGLVIAGFLSFRILKDNAEDEVVETARLMMENALAIRAYTAADVRPLLQEAHFDRFLPETVPSYAAQTNFRRVQQQFPEFYYKEAALNPTNLADLANEWEADIIQRFRNDEGLTEQIAYRETPSGPVMVMSRPLAVGDESCLICHSSVEAAPPEMVAMYGSANGFGWRLNEIIGAQIVSVPLSLPMERARDTFFTFLISLAVVFLIITALLNVVLHFVVVKPVVRISHMASQVSLGHMEEPEFVWKGRDEIGSLASSFNRMRRSLENAMKMLED
ncbi:MAG: DUF3365 domain-containing protein [Rhodospirillaceae bacterium]|nr:DUF3365 domain-containing protein [Rhodospirillaceae bacterium]